MKTTLLKIRSIQLKRLVSELGWFYTLFFLVLLAGLLLVVNRQFQEPGGALLVLAAIAGVVLLVHQHRSDGPFILKHLPFPRRQFFTEYLVFTLPFILPAFGSPYWFLAFLLWPALGCITFLNIGTVPATRLPNLSRLVGAANFEWISGFRQYFPILAAALTLALATSWLKVVPLVFLWLFTVSVASFYQHCEPVTMLAATGKSARKLLQVKLINHGKILLAFSAPILIINAFFQPELAWVNLLFAFLQLTLLAFAILLKYSTYQPNANLQENTVMLSVGALGVIIPFLLPLPLLLSLRNYRKAVSNLNRFLHDQAA